MISPSAIDFLLAALKVIGIVGAFAGFSLEGGAHRKGKRKIAYVFLALAIAAEICDSAVKYRDGQEESERFARLAHPLGDIHVVAFYHISLNNKLVENYRKNIFIRHSLEPDPKSEGMAYALLADTPDLTLFFYGKGTQIKNDSEPDLSFQVNFPDDGRPFRGGPQYPKLGQTVALARHYVFIDHEAAEFFHSSDAEENTITAQIQDTNSQNSRYSDGKIISSEDILGSTIQARFCPEIYLPGRGANDADEAELSRLVVLDGIYLKMPNRKEFSINPADVRNVVFSKSDSCTFMTMKVPDNEGDFAKIVVP